jgi:hypothetical protein
MGRFHISEKGEKNFEFLEKIGREMFFTGVVSSL